jgi:hypothetical protein
MLSQRDGQVSSWRDRGLAVRGVRACKAKQLRD